MAKKKAAKKTTTKKTTKKKTAKASATKKKAVKNKAETEEAAAKKKKKKPTKRSRAKAAADARMKVYWGVFNHAMKRVALYDFNQRRAAEKKAKELNDSGKPPHFVMKIKEVIEEK